MLVKMVMQLRKVIMHIRMGGTVKGIGSRQPQMLILEIMAARVIGITGKIGSGKDEALKYLKARYGVPYISTGDIVREIAGKEGVPPTRDNLDAIAEQCFIELGKGCFVKMVAAEIQKRGWQVAGISGIRAPADVAALKDIFGVGFILLRIEVKDPGLRFRRILGRHEGRDPEKYEEFMTQDRGEEEIFHISKTAAMADFVLKNDGPVEDLHKQIDKLVSAKNLLTSPSA
jgi:dephospho-CoA kinase